jgi:elongation factor G
MFSHTTRRRRTLRLAHRCPGSGLGVVETRGRFVKSYPTENIRNVVLVGHGGAGKTSLAEAMLFRTGAVTRMGKVTDGNTVTDFDEEEHRRGISVSTALAPLEWDGCKINILDAPGYADFVGEMRAAMRVADLALFVVSGVEGIEVQTQEAWRYAEELDLPRMIVVNKLDRENSSFRTTLDALRDTFGKGCAPLNLPLGREHDFHGVISVIDVAAFAYGPSGTFTEQDVPEERRARVDEVRTDLLDSVAETDDDLLERYLEGGEITREEIVAGIHEGVDNARIYPVLCSAATKLIGIDRILDVIVKAGPSPLERPPIEGVDGQAREAKPDGPMSALVFKTMSDPYVGRVSFFRVYSGTLRGEGTIHNATKSTDERIGSVFTMRGKTQDPMTEIVAGDIGAVAKLNQTGTGDTLADKGSPVVFPRIEPPEPLLPKAVQPKTKGDEDKLMIGLHKLIEEDPALKLERNDETHQTILWGMGDAHLDVVLHRLKDKFSVEVEEVPLVVPYRTTIKKPVEALGRHVKQSGGHGQYGICNVRVQPVGRGEGMVFEDKIFGGSIPNQFIPSVEKGVRAAMGRGGGTGYPMIDIKVELYDGKYHTVDSSDMAFQLAGQLALRDAVEKAGVSVLEPIWNLEVLVPDAFTGDIMGDLQKRRGIPEGIEPAGPGRQVVKAKVPFAEVTHYATDLRSMTGGKGAFSWGFSHYQEVPGDLAQKIIDARKADEAASH